MLKRMLDILKCVLESIARVISGTVNFILLLIVYFIGVGSVSLISKLFGKHFLELKKQNRKSSWVEHKLTKKQLESYHRTF